MQALRHDALTQEMETLRLHTEHVNRQLPAEPDTQENSDVTSPAENAARRGETTLLIKCLNPAGGDAGPSLFHCWASVYDAGPTVKQQWSSVSCSVGNVCCMWQ